MTSPFLIHLNGTTDDRYVTDGIADAAHRSFFSPLVVLSGSGVEPSHSIDAGNIRINLHRWRLNLA